MRVKPTYGPEGLLNLGSIPGFLGVPVYEPLVQARPTRNPCSTCGSLGHASLAHGRMVNRIGVGLDYADEVITDLDADVDSDFVDLGDCSYYRSMLAATMFNPVDRAARGLCSYGCSVEPACQTDEPAEGWASCWRFTDVELPFEG